MKNLFYAAVVAILVSLQTGCSGDNAVSPWRDCDCDVGDTCTVDLGSTFTVSLEAAFTAGYKWEFTNGFDERYVELESYSVVPVDPDDQREGVPMYQKWTYRAREQGTVCATLVYGCAWEKDDFEKMVSIFVIIE